MANNQLNKAKKRFQRLVGSSLSMIHFAGDTSMLVFSTMTTAFNIHAQCSYRFIYKNATILCKNDYWTTVNHEKFNTLVHVERDLLAQYVLPITVTSVCLHDDLDLFIELQDEYALRIYADLPSVDEQWRFWENSAEPRKQGSCFIAIGGTVIEQRFGL